MEYIRQKNSSLDGTYVVVLTNGWNKPLSEHPSIVNRPNSFEITSDPIPEDAQYLDYNE